jgi:hypothetical protein
VSYDLQIVAPGGIPRERAEAALVAAGVELDGDEGVVDRGDVIAQFLVSGDEIGIGVTTKGGDGSGFRDVLEIVLTTAETLDAQVVDQQAGTDIDRTNLDEALEAFG